jgi:hypothetical protein
VVVERWRANFNSLKAVDNICCRLVGHSDSSFRVWINNANAAHETVYPAQTRKESLASSHGHVAPSSVLAIYWDLTKVYEEEVRTVTIIVVL